MPLASVVQFWLGGWSDPPDIPAAVFGTVDTSRASGIVGVSQASGTVGTSGAEGTVG